MNRQYEEATTTLYRALGITEPSQLNPIAIAKGISVDLVYMPVDSISVNDTIYLDSRLSPAMQWQQFGRELYRVLHHPANQLRRTSDDIGDWHKEADLFALCACMPSVMISDMRLPSTERETVTTLADTFNVTEEFAAKRIALNVASMYKTI